ncbi:hypothetical protein STCU_09392 [Strigomonas culicis]|nr:hypothetical protein STCU_09392 [Strigomonas culicis]|eukprot:EPY19555.1 hypothetical protein STCU_09392 [Strigomonas culicis]
MANVINMNSKLLCVDVQGNKLSAPDVRKLLKSIATSTTVTRLNISSNEIGPDGAALVQKALARNTYITHLNLSMNELGPSGAASLAELLAVPTCAVQTLLLYGNYLGDDGVRMLCEAIQGNKEVKRFTLGNNNVTDNCAAAIAAMLEANRTLEELDLRLNAFTVGGMKRLCKNGLEQNSTLSYLSLSGNPLGPVGADELAKSLAAHRTSGVTRLDISSCSIGPTGGMRIALLLKTSNVLQEINLADNLLDDEAAVAIANNITVAESITDIDLSSNAINDEGATFLLDAANENTRITAVTLQGNRLNRVLQKKIDTLLEERMVLMRFQKRPNFV